MLSVEFRAEFSTQIEEFVSSYFEKNTIPDLHYSKTAWKIRDNFDFFYGWILGRIYQEGLSVFVSTYERQMTIDECIDFNELLEEKSKTVRALITKLLEKAINRN